VAEKIARYENDWNESEFLDLRKRLFTGRTDEDFKQEVFRIFEDLFARRIFG